MGDNFENMFDQGDHIPDNKLLEYSQGKLSAKEAHKVEKHLLECELCSDTLEGLNLMQSPDSSAVISELNKKIDARIESFNGKKGTIITMRPYYRIAAVIALFILFGGGYWFLKNGEKEKILAENTASKNTDSISSQLVPQTQLAPQVSSDQKAEEPISAKPQFSLPEKKAMPLSHTVSSSTNEQTTRNDIEKNKIDDIKQQNDNSQSRDQNIQAEVITTNEGLGKQSREIKDEESHAGSAAPSVMESAVSSRKEKVANDDIAFQKNADMIVADKPSTLFSRGKANLDAKNYVAATIDFERLLNDTTSDYYDDSKWFLAICYAKTQQNAKSRKLLKQIAVSNSIHKKEAEGLLQESE
ncbi:MAG: hypothetical protein ABI763_08380 [Bacteroidota bacterium]